LDIIEIVQFIAFTILELFLKVRAIMNESIQMENRIILLKDCSLQFLWLNVDLHNLLCMLMVEI